ncbi:MAG: 3(2), 5-bisphosphate nucleotidase [Sphingomonadales bacterium]|jgi:3'(2'), 5'-bisphosphate nucleotidase|nr:3(2), 5-bisphosphate nucleotidase [Sphingomonadales bacterium]
MGDMSDAEIAARAADAAGRLLMELRAGGLITGPAIGTAGDLLANQLILAAIRERRPDDGILSEESPDRPDRLARSRVWIVDPLDGTREYGEGRDDWAVHVGLAIDGVAAAGAVAVPARGRLFRSDDAAVAVTEAKRRPVLLVSRTRPPREGPALAAALGAELREMGSAGAKTAAVVAGEADIYFHSGGQHEWDNCAPVAVAKGAGLHVSRRDGSALVYNQQSPLVPDLLICRPEWASRAIDALSAADRA